MSRGAILWEGPSKVDGAPIVAIATGLQGTCKNPKTGDMVQTWILRRDMPPGKAAASGADASVCGSCIHRNVDGLGSCYVNVGWGPRRIWDAYKRGAYPGLDERAVLKIRSRHVRFGSYGDPAAVPVRVWYLITPEKPGDSTGYTHMWRTRAAKPYRSFLMASVDSLAELEEAKAKGWRAFLVVPHNRSVPKELVWCPSDKLNPAAKLSCQKCGLCSGVVGKGKKSVGIMVHGAASATFKIRERKPNLIKYKARLDDIVHVRIERDLHTLAKAHAKEQKQTLKMWVREAVTARLSTTTNQG